MRNWDSVLVIGLVVIAGIIRIKSCASKVNDMLLYLVIKAEEQFGGGTGDIKYSAVVTWIYERLPSIITWLFTKKQIDKMIEDAVSIMKEYLNKNSKAMKLILN